VGKGFQATSWIKIRGNTRSGLSEKHDTTFHKNTAFYIPILILINQIEVNRRIIYPVGRMCEGILSNKLHLSKGT